MSISSRWPLPACLALLLGACATDLSQNNFTVFNGMVTSGGTGAKWEEIPVKAVSQKDTIYVMTHVRWEPTDKDLGIHTLEWDGYSADGKQVIKHTDDRMRFKASPYRFWYYIAASDLEVGHYKVNVLIDGRLVDTQEFDVTK